MVTQHQMMQTPVMTTGQGSGGSHLSVPIRLAVPGLPLRLHNHPRAQDQSDEQDGVPQLLEVLLQGESK